MNAARFSLLALSSLLLLGGCHLFGPRTGGGEACTEEFRSYQVVVTDTLGQPAPDVIVGVRRAGGRSIICPIEGGQGCVQPGPGRAFDGEPTGRYTVMDDGVSVRRGGERFTVEATRGTLNATAVLSFGYDGCHVRKLGGPDTLRLAR